MGNQMNKEKKEPKIPLAHFIRADFADALEIIGECLSQKKQFTVAYDGGTYAITVAGYVGH